VVSLKEKLKEFRRNPLRFIKTYPEVILIPSIFFGVLALWEGLVNLYNIPIYLIAPPSLVLRSLIKGLYSKLYFLHFQYTIVAVLLGFSIGAVIGTFLGALIAQFRLLEKTLYPYLVAFQTLPKIAIVPLLILWFGFGISSKVAMAAMVSFFPILVNLIVGLKSVDQEKIDLLRSLSATEWQIFRMVKFPHALPHLFAGLDIGIIFSVLAVIVGEFVGAHKGLGMLIVQMNFNLDVAGVFSVLIILCAVGVGLHLIIQRIQKKLVFWAERETVIGA
jgi:NitT/TauT family transport system permease protein